jgi:hypothetical protein
MRRWAFPAWRAARRQAGVYVAHGSGAPRLVPVALGASDGERTEVLSSGLAPGDQVIIGWRREKRRGAQERNHDPTFPPPDVCRQRAGLPAGAPGARTCRRSAPRPGPPFSRAWLVAEAQRRARHPWQRRVAAHAVPDFDSHVRLAYGAAQMVAGRLRLFPARRDIALMR